LVPPERDSITLETICQTLVSSGYFEAITFSFVSDSLQGDFGQSTFRADGAVRKSDAALRPSLLPGLLEAVRFNEANGMLGAKLFEIGSMFPGGAGAALNEQRAVAFVGGEIREVRGVVEALLGRLDAERRVRVVPDSHPGFAAGACGRIEWGDATVGFIGKIDRAVGEKLSLRELPAAAELELAPLLAGSRHVPQLRDLPRFPGVRRDVSLIVQENIRFEKIESLLRDLALPFLEGIEFVTAYRGKPLESGTKSVTITLVFRSPTGTMTSDEVEASVQKAVAAATERLGAAVRS
jgi:phenylalanyl-tRNA synthetase beta chain